jgi:hypothetical protein
MAIINAGVGMTPEGQPRAFEPFFPTKGPEESCASLSQVCALERQSAVAM